MDAKGILHEIPWFGSLITVLCSIKILFFPAYHSTDFEVHRNWLAITHSLPVSKWYHENTSEWTLDYPPFFAWFEFVMSYVASLFDEKMLDVNNLEYASQRTIIFQRLSVVVADFCLIYSVYRFCQTISQVQKRSSDLLKQKSFVFAVLVLFNFGLLVVDHIHFQYNGFLFGILLLSIVNILEGKPFHGAFLFAILLNFKHIFLYIAPAYFIYLLREVCFRKDSSNYTGIARILGVRIQDFLPVRLGILGFVVISVFSVSFGPFIYMGDLHQVFARLFPVKRGLCHAYWAANSWALYNVLDKVAIIIGRRSGLLLGPLKEASMTGGLVAQQEHQVLPTITPLVTVVVTLLTMMPVILRVWYKPSGPRGFLRALILCAYSSFLFGYHVHEKAILLVLIPLSLLAVNSKQVARVFLIASSSGHYALFPLFYQPAETPIKVALYCAFTAFSAVALGKVHGSKDKAFGLPFLNCLEALYIYGLGVLHLYCSCVHNALGLQETLPFVPLLLTSVYCSLGILWSWLLFYKQTLMS